MNQSYILRWKNEEKDYFHLTKDKLLVLKVWEELEDKAMAELQLFSSISIQ